MMEDNTVGMGMVLLVAKDFLVIPALVVHMHGSDVKGRDIWRLNNYDNFF